MLIVGLLQETIYDLDMDSSNFLDHQPAYFKILDYGGEHSKLDFSCL